MINLKFLWHFIRVPHRLMYRIGLGPLVGSLILLLTTYGRKTGKPHITPVQYEEIDGRYFVGSALGVKADWFRNVVANPLVNVQVKTLRFQGMAEPITDPKRIADFMRLRLQRRPRLMGAMLRGAGLPNNPTQEQLEAYAANRAMVIITSE